MKKEEEKCISTVGHMVPQLRSWLDKVDLYHFNVLVSISHHGYLLISQNDEEEN